MRRMRWEKSAPIFHKDKDSAGALLRQKFLTEVVYIVVKMGTIHKG